jgi:hypothetical protein
LDEFDKVIAIDYLARRYRDVTTYDIPLRADRLLAADGASQSSIRF